MRVVVWVVMRGSGMLGSCRPGTFVVSSIRTLQQTPRRAASSLNLNGINNILVVLLGFQDAEAVHLPACDSACAQVNLSSSAVERRQLHVSRKVTLSNCRVVAVRGTTGTCRPFFGVSRSVSPDSLWIVAAEPSSSTKRAAQS